MKNELHVANLSVVCNVFYIFKKTKTFQILKIINP